MMPSKNLRAIQGGGGKSRGRGGNKKRGKAGGDPVQQLTDTYISQIDELTEAKETELLELRWLL